MVTKTQGIGAIGITSTVIVAIVMIASLGGQTLGNPTITVNETGTYEVGNTMVVKVLCNPDGKFVKAWECKLNYNKNVLQAVSVVEGNFLKPYVTFFNPGIIQQSNGKIINIYNLIVGTGNVTASRYMFNVTFNVIGYGYANVSLYDVGLTNETQYITGLTVVNGTNFVYSPYDMNNDKTVNVQDLVSIATHYGETGTSGWIKQDVNKDGKISVIDMVIVSTHWGSY